HLENFGAFNGDNRLDYFDLNDFDEAALGPCSRDPVRCLCSLFLAADEAGCRAGEGRTLGSVFLDGYAGALRDGRGRWLERDTATGVVRELLSHLEHRTRLQLLEMRTVLRGGERRIRLDGTHALPAKGKEKAWARRLVQAATAPHARKFFRVVDAARRIAGTGSLGIERYVVVVEGKGSPRGKYLLDVKAASASAMNVSLESPQPGWSSEAQRIVWVQSHMQAASPALLHAVNLEGRSYVVKELQPREDRLTFKKMDKAYPSFREAVQAMGNLLA